MDFAVTPEQESIRDAVDKICRKYQPEDGARHGLQAALERVRNGADSMDPISSPKSSEA